MSRLILRIVVPAVLVVSTVAACGGGSGSGAADTAGGRSSSSASATSASAAGGSAAGSAAGTVSTGGGSSSASTAAAPVATASNEPKASGGLPSDVCALLGDADVSPVVTGAVKTLPTSQGDRNVSCSWVTDTDTLSVTLLTGIPSATVKLSIDEDAKENDGHDVAAGDYAKGWVTAVAGYEVKGLVGDTFFDVQLLSLNRGDRGAAMEAIAKKVAGSIG